MKTMSGRNREELENNKCLDDVADSHASVEKNTTERRRRCRRRRGRSRQKKEGKFFNRRIGPAKSVPSE